MLYECVDCHKRNPGPLHCCCNTNINPSTTHAPVNRPVSIHKPVNRPASIPRPVSPATTYAPTYHPVSIPTAVNLPASIPTPVHKVSRPTPVNHTFNLPSFPSFPSLPSFPSFGFKKCKKEGHQVGDLHRLDKPDQLSDCDIRMACVDCGKVNPGHLHCCC